MEPDLTMTPTGYAPTALPFYSGMDDGGFEQFCADLLNLHPTIVCLRGGQVTTRRIAAASRLLGGTPQKGADVRAEADQGEVWFFQCKHTQRFSPADVSAAIDLAEKGFPQADQFVLVTTCGLSEEAQRRIHERPKWLWWDASKLTTEVLKLRPREEAINLIFRYFGTEWKKALLPTSDQPLLKWNEFYLQDLSSDRHHFHHRIPFVPWSDALARLESFARSGAGRALILSAAGGQGKSRLLLELAQKLENQPGAPRVRFLNLGRHGLAADQSEWLSREEGELLLIIDDAHRLDAAVQDVARATFNAASIRLLVATRPQALEAVRSQLFQSGYAERLEEPFHLPRWKSEEIQLLAERVLSPQHQLQAPSLTSLADRCPLLVVLGGALLNAGDWPGAMANQEAFRERVFRSFKEDFLGRQAENHRDRMDRLIKLLSFVSPTPKNEKLLEKASEILGCSALDVADDLDRLQLAGMIVGNREGIRLYPDLFADAVILDASLDQSGGASALCRAILQKLPSEDFPALMRNLAQADWEARTRLGARSQLFEPVWKEFVSRFENGVWVNPERLTEWILEKYADGNATSRPSDRVELLGQWASFAVYLPERTLELAELAMKTIEDSANNGDGITQNHARVAASGALTPLLKPIVIWHPAFSERALNFLWKLDANEPRANWQNSSNAITAIAEAGSFNIHRPMQLSASVVEWLDRKTQEPATIERLRQQPWILGAVLKPFFGREVEHTWSTNKTFHVSSWFVSAKNTRPLRQKALGIAKRFLDSVDVQLCNAVIPIINEAISPLYARFALNPKNEDQLEWRPDRLEVLKLIENAVETYKNIPALLLQFRRILWRRCEYESDEVVLAEAERVLKGMPDTFELRVARLLTSFSQDEVRVKRDQNSDSEIREAEMRWAEFRQAVARETVQRFQTARELCEFTRRQVRELTATSSLVQGGALLDLIAEVSPAWCSSILEELLGAEDKTLDGFLWAVLQQAASKTPETYRKAIESLPVTGRVEQLRSLISYFGWKHLHGGGLTEPERKAVLVAANRAEEGVVNSVALVAGHHFENDPQWAIQVLVTLKPAGERDAAELLQALARLAKEHYAKLKPGDIAQCLENIGENCIPVTVSDEHSLDTIGEKFPRQVYEHVRKLQERAEATPATHHQRRFAVTLSLGPFDDEDYVDAEIHKNWRKAISPDLSDLSQTCRFDLIRCLLWSNGGTAAKRIHDLIEQCKSGEELKHAADLVATRGSRFVFQYPDLVQALLMSSQNLNVAGPVGETLLLSACGGGRSFHEHELVPEDRYILEQGDAMANRYADNVLLGRFYRTIAEYERKNLEWHRQAFANDDVD